MSNKQFEPKPHPPSVGRLLSDLALIEGGRNSPIWKNLFFRPGEALWMVFVQFLQAHTSLLAYAYCAITKTSHGALAGGGAVQTVAILLWGAAYNSVEVWPVFSSVTGWFIAPFHLWQQSPGQLLEMLWTDIESRAMAIFLLVFAAFSILRTGLNWAGRSNASSVTSRGTSYSYLLLQHLIGEMATVNTYVVDFLQGMAVFGVGCHLHFGMIDPCFGRCLMAISGSELILLLFERAHGLKKIRMMKA